MAIEDGVFGAELRRLRTETGMSLGALAGQVHCSRSFLSRIETGQRRVTHELAQACDQILDAKGALLDLVPPSDHGPTGRKSRRRTADSRAEHGHSVADRRHAEFVRLLARGDAGHAAGDMRTADHYYRAAYVGAAGDPEARAEAVIRMARRWSDPGQVDHELIQLIRGSLTALGDPNGVPQPRNGQRSLGRPESGEGQRPPGPPEPGDGQRSPGRPESVEAQPPPGRAESGEAQPLPGRPESVEAQPPPGRPELPTPPGRPHPSDHQATPEQPELPDHRSPTSTGPDGTFTLAPIPTPTPATSGLRLRLTAHLAKKLTMGVGPDTADRTAPEEGARLAADTLRRLRADSRARADDEVRCEVLTECRWGRYDFVPAAESLALSEELRDAAARHGSAYFRGEALMALAVDQLRTGKVYSALATAHQYRKHAAGSRSALVHWQQRTLDALLDLWHGRYEQAAAWVFGESPAFVERLRGDLAVPADNLDQTRLGQAYWLLREQGRMAELFTSGLAEGVERHGYFPVWRAGLALALCETGRPDEAADRLAGFAADTGHFDRFPPSGWAVPTLVLLAEVCGALDAYGGHEEVLHAVVPALRARLAAHGGEQIALAGWPTVLVGPTARAAGLLALAVGEPVAALAHFRYADDAVRSSQPELARLRLARARALHRAGRPGDATHANLLVRESLRVAGAYGMRGLAAQCETELGKRS
ncbi:helix-turn-helix domain protein [Actinobacteria bacterium OK074]|nr:helix-turn-helix domain protein [Actinobacteria bacterium OK074]